jgi:hypothetical protein
VITAQEANQLAGVIRTLTAVGDAAGSAVLAASQQAGSVVTTLTHSIATALNGDPNEPYYWESPVAASPPVAKVITHNLHWVALRTWGTMETVGEFFSEILGLQNSRYAWAAELGDREREAAEEAEAEAERQRRWAEIHALNAASAPKVPEGAAPAPAPAPATSSAATTAATPAASEGPAAAGSGAATGASERAAAAPGGSPDAV